MSFRKEKGLEDSGAEAQRTGGGLGQAGVQAGECGDFQGGGGHGDGERGVSLSGNLEVKSTGPVGGRRVGGRDEPRKCNFDAGVSSC